MENKKQRYRFWRWLILTTLRFPKLYALVWGIIVLTAVVFLKWDIINLIHGVMP